MAVTAKGKVIQAGRRLQRSCAIVLGAVFIAASISKILHPAAFARAVFRYHLLPDLFINPLAIYLPWLELTCGVLIAFRSRWRPAAALLITGMLAVFTAAIAINLVRGLDISCGCFSVDPRHGRIGLLSIARNLVLLLMSVTVYLTGRE
ncbi:MAG TPA: DoxX family membrane protein [Kiritimatiellae bacterium]|nr:DoxX family membrane protein [Kiritimatiellia bacterium]